MPPHILLFEQDPCIASLLAYPLSNEGYAVTRSDWKRPATSMQSDIPFDLIVYDLENSDTDDMEILHLLRRRSLEAPVAILSSNRDEGQIAKYLRAGAEDYIVKPFNVEEFLARIYVILRRFSMQDLHNRTAWLEEPDTCCEFGNLLIFPQRYEICYEDRKLTLPVKEFQLLLYLAKRKGNLVSRNELALLFSNVVDPKACRKVDIYISSLRKILQHCPSAHIESIRGRGYKIANKLASME